MHALEYILFVTSIAVEKNAIKRPELARALLQLASASHSYEPVDYENPSTGGPRNADEELASMGEEWRRRFDYLIYD